MQEPDALQQRPHYGRYPIPYITAVGEDGTPDFRAHDTGRRNRAARDRLCQLCAEPLGEAMQFIGTEDQARRMRFGEPPAHPECLDYARAVCPWLGGSPHSEREGIAFTWVPRPDDPRYLRIVTATGYRLERDQHCLLVFLPEGVKGKPLWVLRFKHELPGNA